MRVETNLRARPFNVMMEWRACLRGVAVFVVLCAASANVAAQQSCSVDADCDDGIACTFDDCFGITNRFCVHSSICDDGKPCNGSELCCLDPLGCAGGVPQGGCIAGTPVVCGPLEFCVNIGIGECVECNDDSGVGPLVGCDDGEQCTEDLCESGVCTYTSIVVSCDDGSLCTDNDVCSDGVCQGTLKNCLPRICFGGTNDGIGCAQDPSQGFVCPNPGACIDLVCVGGADDGIACTMQEDCTVGTAKCLPFCIGGTNDRGECLTDADCPLGSCSSCQVGTCNSGSGQCEYPPISGARCNDGVRCTAEDVCVAGECVGGISAGACIDLELRRSFAQETIQVGDTLKVEVWATMNGCNLALITECSGAGMPLFGVNLAFSWDATVFELLTTRDPCDGTGCGDVYCSSFPKNKYDWAAPSGEAFPNDCALDGLNADCDPDTCCPIFTGNPFNDGDALAVFLHQLFCSPSQPACVFGDGLQITTLEFRALRATAGLGAPSEVRLESCLGDTPSEVIRLGGGENPIITRDLGLPATVTVACTTEADCPPGAACVGGSCVTCLPPTVKVIGPRYISISPDPTITAPVALLVSGVDVDVDCVSSYVTMPGGLGLTPRYQTAEVWGSVSTKGIGIVAGRTYQVRSDCDSSNPGTSMSDPVEITLWLDGDVDNNNVVDILDITRGIDSFRGLLLTGACNNDGECASVPPNFECDLVSGRCRRIKLENVDIIGAGACTAPEGAPVSILDISAIIDEFRSFPTTCIGPCE